MEPQGKLRVVVTGGADAPRSALDLAHAIGYQVVQRGHILINGGAKGVDRSAAHGGYRYRKKVDPNFTGQIIAYRPGNSSKAHSSRYTDVHVVGNTHAERRDAVVRSGDILIVLSGSRGTLDMAKRARNYGKPIIPLGCSGGTALELWHDLVDDDGRIYPYRERLSEEMLQSLNPLDYQVDDVARLTVDLAEKIAVPVDHPVPEIEVRELDASQGRQLRVFLCYARDDIVAVRELYHSLINDNVDAWLDKENILPGQNWECEIKKAVRTSDAVLVCLSMIFNQQGFRQKEVRLALETMDKQPQGEIFIIPARLEECENLESLSQWQWVDLFAQDGYERLMSALKVRAQSIGVFL